ncbi:uncharacterized protein [Lolium perenne]|uniref:uncharacterized protein n=1 Tax=Lolium perenne TaxID=4522 RepID=UPI003A9A6594
MVYIEGTGKGATADAEPSFINMENIVQIDEKWFDMTKKRRTYYLLPEEQDPVRTVQNKNNIGKDTPAKNNSKNRLKGTIELKSVIVTRNVMREYLCEKVIPAIQDQWPLDDVGTIFIQQDNARTHVLPTDASFLQAVAESGLDIKLLQQPPNSPDMNVLDLCFFASIQSLTLFYAPNTLKELIESIKHAYDGYEVNKLVKVFITLQSCMIEVMEIEGEFHYDIPHMGKEKLLKGKKLPTTLTVKGELYQKTLELIAGH